MARVKLLRRRRATKPAEMPATKQDARLAQVVRQRREQRVELTSPTRASTSQSSATAAYSLAATSPVKAESAKSRRSVESRMKTK